MTTTTANERIIDVELQARRAALLAAAEAVHEAAAELFKMAEVMIADDENEAERLSTRIISHLNWGKDRMLRWQRASKIIREMRR